MTKLAALTAITHSIIHELNVTVKSIPEDDIEQLIDQIAAAKRIFVAGAGRSGLMMRAFAMRLMHSGLQVHVVGDTTTPGLEADDLLIIGSGSGETGSLVNMASKAKKLNAQVAIATVRPESTIGKLADTVILVPAAAKEGSTGSGAGSGITTIQPMGSLFEQSLLLLFDAIVLRYMERMNIDAAAMFGRHANLE
ncbi:6-phospho-3-hexuloisomerase [Paenibacillus sp. GCM10027626]|uniref:6-phospho-3-hexuloisomerase n=1 Tax=Paenibacillus sp. GCM10027626 TaxID=3273411 RepID=UPI00362E3A5F